METSADFLLFNYPVAIVTYTPQVLWYGVGIVIFLIISASIYAAAIAYSNISIKQIEELKKSSNTKSNQILELLEKPQLLRIHIMISNLLSQTAIVAFLFIILQHIFHFPYKPFIGLALEIVFVTCVLLICSKTIPGYIARNYSIKTAFALTPLILVITKLMSPFNSIFLKIHIPHGKQTHTIADDIADALHLTSTEIAQEKEILEGIAKLTSTDISTIMTPRVSIFAIEISLNFKDLLLQIIDSGYSRIPVYSQTLDTIKGILYIKDLLPHIQKPPTFRWQTLIRPAYFVPESKKTDVLLEEFQKSKIHLAVIIDEYGGTCGIVTLEDILEEILGEISDEFDVDDEALFTKIDDETYVFDGKISVHDVCKLLELAEDYFDEFKGDAESLAGLILEIKGDFPKINEEFVCNNVRLIIEAEDARRIQKIKLILAKNFEQ